MRLQFSDEQRVFALNAVILLLIVLFLLTIPSKFIFHKPKPSPNAPDTNPQSPALSQSGNQTMLVLLHEYNLNYVQHYTSIQVTDKVTFCTAFPDIDQSGCREPAVQRVFLISNQTSHGWIGYARFPSLREAEAAYGELASARASKDGGYLHVSYDVSSITDYALVDKPDEFAYAFHPDGDTYDHAWIARFGDQLVFAYENTPTRRIERKLTHAFSPQLRARAIAGYNLTYGTTLANP